MRKGFADEFDQRSARRQNFTKLIIFIGAPASGKSTIAKKISQCTEIFLASKDDFKIEIFERCGFSSNAEKKFLGEIAENNFYNFVSKFIDENKNLIVEGCFKNLDKLCRIAKNFSVCWIICRADSQILIRLRENFPPPL